MTADELAAPVEGMPEEPLYYDDHGEPATGRGGSQPSMVSKSAYDDLRANFERLRAGNTMLRALLPKMGAPCIHCGLTEMAKCAHGFPGCAKADDLLVGEEEGWKAAIERMKKAEAENALLKAAVRDAAAHWDKYLVDDYYLARWLRNHAAAIAMAGKP